MTFNNQTLNSKEGSAMRKEPTALDRIKRIARRISREEQRSSALRVFEGLGWDEDDVAHMAESVGLEADDLFLMSTTSVVQEGGNVVDGQLMDQGNEIVRLLSEVHREVCGTSVIPLNTGCRTQCKSTDVPRLVNARLMEFRIDADVCHLKYGDAEVIERATYPRSKGLQLYAILIQRPAQVVSVGELAASIGSDVPVQSSRQEVVDSECSASVRKKLDAIQAEIDDTVNPERIEELEDEKCQIESSMAAAKSRWRRSRSFSDPMKRAKDAIHANLRRARRRLESRMPQLAAHLNKQVRAEGGGFIYEP
jgi:hypothetical protein